MRVLTGLFMLSTCAFLALGARSEASALPRLSGLASNGSALVLEAKTPRSKAVRKFRTTRPYYAPYFCSHPYAYRYWQFYPPVCYPLNRPLPQYKR